MTRLTASKPLVLAGLFMVAALMAEEGSHLRRWDRKGIRHIIKAADAGDCERINADGSYRWCSVPGYGKTLYRCTARECTYADPSAPRVSMQEMEKEQADMDSMGPLEEDPE